MIVLCLFIYFGIGFSISCFHNAIHDVGLPSEMTEEEKNIMFGITLVWPIYLIFVFIKRFIRFIKWLLKI